MKLTQTVKTLILVGLGSLTVATGAQADFGQNRGFTNPWLEANPAFQHVNFKQHLADFDVRLDSQLQRILRGMESGKVTMREAVDLLREHQEINALERKYLSDGRLGGRELAELDRRLDVADQRIQFEKNDRERARLGLNDRDDHKHGGRW